MKKKIITAILLVLGLLMIILGIVAICQCGMSHGQGGYKGYLTRASTGIEFGADFYTTSAQYTGLAANAVCDLYTFVSCAFGVFFMFIGGLDICLTLLFTNIKELFAKPVKNEQAISDTIVSSEEESQQAV